MAKNLYINAKECKACGACEEVCPEVFRLDEDLGYAQVLDSDRFPEDKIHEAIINCPGRCIVWEEATDGNSPGDLYFCQKYQEDIKSDLPVCRHPKDYCQFRSSCPVHFLEKENTR